MTTATRLDTPMSCWAPITRHYQVDGGYLAVTVNNFLTAKGTDVFYADAEGGAISLTPLIHYPDGTSHDEVLQALGYTVVDDVGPEPKPDIAESPTPQEQSVLDMLPPEIASVILPALEGGS